MTSGNERDDDDVIRPSPAQAAWMKREFERMQELERGRPELFSEVMSTNDIMRAAHEVRRRCLTGEDPRDVREKHMAFAVQYPVIFERCCTPSASLHMLPFLLRQLQTVRDSPTPQTKEAATDEVCRALNSEYVDPVLAQLERERKR